MEVGSDGLRALPKVPERAVVRVDLLEKGLLVVNPLILNAQKGAKTSGFAQKSAPMKSFTQKRAHVCANMRSFTQKSAQERSHSKKERGLN